MSHYLNATRTTHPDENNEGGDDGDSNDDSFDLTVHIPDAFKKSRKNKIKDTSAVLTRLQALMSDIRAKET